jgi:hypothetical protein
VGHRQESQDDEPDGDRRTEKSAAVENEEYQVYRGAGGGAVLVDMVLRLCADLNLPDSPCCVVQWIRPSHD